MQHRDLIVQVPVSRMRSGTEQQVLQLSTELVRSGRPVTMIIPTGDGLDLLAEAARDAGVGVERIGLLFGDRATIERTLKQFWSTVRRLRPSILHMHFPFLYWNRQLIACARLAGARTIVRTEQNPINAPATRNQRLSMHALDHFVQRIAFVSTGNMEKQIELCGRPVEKCVVIPNAIDPTSVVDDRSPAWRRAIRAELGLPDDAVVAVKIGAYDPRQGLLEFLQAGADAASRHPMLHLVVLGASPQEEEARRVARAHGIEARLHFLGQRPDVRRILSSFDIYVQASYFEGLSIAMLEALAAGLPMVTTRVDGVSDVLADGDGALLADIGDTTGLAKHIAYLVENADARDALSSVTYRRVREEFTAARQLTRWTELYQDVTGRR